MPDNALDIVQRANQREGLRGWIDRGIGIFTGDSGKAQILTDIADLSPTGNFTAANELPAAIRDAIKEPGVQSALAAALTGASLIPLASPLAKAAKGAAKDAGRTAHIFAGPKALHADENALARSEVALAQGVHPDTVWQETGWNPNVANQAVWEIDDQPAKYFPKKEAGLYNIGDVFEHPEMYQNYPDLQGVGVMISARPTNQLGYQAQWDRGANRIVLAKDVADDPVKARSAMLHELQHAVQDVEGFPRGGSPRYMEQLYADFDPEIRANAHDIDTDSTSAIAYEQYMRLAGETEARNVQTRRDMANLQRRNLAPQWTEDRLRPKQIILDGDFIPVARNK